MKRRFKLKINGESPRSIFLAFVLAKLNCDIYIFDCLKNPNPKKNNQIFLFSNFSKNLLIKLDIWNEIEDISYDFSSLSINDNSVSERLLLRTENFPKSSLNSIGWIASYSDIKNVLINKLIDLDNVHFYSKNQLIDKSLNFDYEFNFEGYDKVTNLFKLSSQNTNKIDEQILIFNVYLRGHVEKRLYEIITTKGLLVLTPLNKNLYQVIWNNASFQIKETALRSKSLFLDNLITLLPNEVKIDQIIGDVNFLKIRNISSAYFFKNNSIYFNENKFATNNIYNFNFDIVIRNFLQIYNFFESNEHKIFKFLNKFVIINLLRKYFEIKINFSFTNNLFYLFKGNDFFSLFFRKLLFIIFKRVNLIKFLVFKSVNISNINHLSK